ncbi:MAG: hypothetical protein K6A36_07440 [Paludibacteraceae bacterium]|nr:hypothetical protein [Paludibacteraceae bacterium]
MMKKIYTLLMLTLFSMIALATPSFTVSTDSIDFGTIYLDNSGWVDTTEHFTVTWSDLLEYGGVSIELLDTVDNGHYYFELSTVYLYGGDEYTNPAEPDVWLSFLGDAPGTYTCNIRVSTYTDYVDYNEIEQIIPVSVRVEALSTSIEKIEKDRTQCTKVLRNGQLYLVRNGAMYSVQGQVVK